MKASNKTLIGAGAAILFLFSLIYVFSNKNQPAAPASPTKIIATTNGNVVVRDFSQNSVAEISGTTIISQTPQFKIVYYAADSSFAIVLLAQPLQQSRDAAEQEFLARLSIDHAQACQLAVTLSVPYSVDPRLAGPDYALSFCPNSRQFATVHNAE